MKQKILKLREQGKTYKEIQQILGCSKGAISYHCSKLKNHNFKSKVKSKSLIKKMNKLYNEGKSTLQVAKLLGISKTTVSKNVNLRVKIKLTEDELKSNNYKKVKTRRKKVKMLLVDYKGGKCQNCGYNKCLEAFDFHHRNPKEKSFGLSSAGLSRSLEILKKEVDKCDLLCANCHREVHANWDVYPRTDTA